MVRSNKTIVLCTVLLYHKDKLPTGTRVPNLHLYIKYTRFTLKIPQNILEKSFSDKPEFTLHYIYTIYLYSIVYMGGGGPQKKDFFTVLCISLVNLKHFVEVQAQYSCANEILYTHLTTCQLIVVLTLFTYREEEVHRLPLSVVSFLVPSTGTPYAHRNYGKYDILTC